MKSILSPELAGAILVGGRRGVGKTYFISQLDNPRLICFIDFEEKGRAMHHKLNFGAYHSALPGPDLYQDILNIIDNIKDNQFTVVVFDNVSVLEDAMKAEAKKNAKKYADEFGLSQKNITSGRFGGPSSVVNKLISYKISAPLHRKGVKLIAGTAHAKSFWGTGGPIPNKWNILGADRWQELAVLSLILIKGDSPPIPSAIVKKEQLGSIVFDEETGEFNIKRRLPFRVPECTPKIIIDYLTTPANLDSPISGETVSEAEYAMYSAELTNEQLEMNKMSLEIQQHQIRKEEKEELELAEFQQNEIKEKVLGLVQTLDIATLPPAAKAARILNELKKDYPELTGPEVKEMVK